MDEETVFENFIRAVEGTKSSAEVQFDDVMLRLPGLKTGFVVSGKISCTIRPIHERQKV